MSFKYVENKRNFERQYGHATISGKIILDIGADWGSTPHWFITKGASYVYAVDGSKRFVDQMHVNLEQYSVKPIHLYIKKPEHFEQLLRSYPAYLVKIDIEGDERHLLEVPIEVLRKPWEYLIETHDLEVKHLIIEKLTHIGFRLELDVYSGRRTTGVQWFSRAVSN